MYIRSVVLDTELLVHDKMTTYENKTNLTTMTIVIA